MSLSYATRQIGDVAVLDLTGRVSLSETPSGPIGKLPLHDVVRNIVNTGSKKILINLRNVDYVDSSGLGELVACGATASTHGADMKVCNANLRVNDLLVITSLKAVLGHYPDEEAALRAFAQPKKASGAA